MVVNEYQLVGVWKTCSKCGNTIVVARDSDTTTGYSGNTESSYFCPQCKTLYVSNKSYAKCVENAPISKSKNYCKLCNNSGYDRKGKPCRDCR